MLAGFISRLHIGDVIGGFVLCLLRLVGELFLCHVKLVLDVGRASGVTDVPNSASPSGEREEQYGDQSGHFFIAWMSLSRRIRRRRSDRKMLTV